MPLSSAQATAAGPAGKKKVSRHDKVVRSIYENFNRFYGYKSLFHFKNKFQPVWKGRYLAYRHLHDLTLIACAMIGIHFPRRGLWHILHS